MEVKRGHQKEAQRVEPMVSKTGHQKETQKEANWAKEKEARLAMTKVEDLERLRETGTASRMEHQMASTS